MQPSTGPSAQINQILCQREGHWDSHFWEGDFQQDHQKAVKDFQKVEACLKEDFSMQNQGEEETLDKDQTNWWEIHLKCSQEYKQKLSTSLLNGSITSVLTSLIPPLPTTTRGVCSSSPISKDQEYQNGCLP